MKKIRGVLFTPAEKHFNISLMNTFSIIAYRYLKNSGIQVNSFFLRQRLESHPDYPSLLSLTDTLNELGIKYKAFRLNKEKLNELRFPVLLYIKKNNCKEFLIVNSSLEIERNKDYYFNLWDGIVLSVEKSDIKNTEHGMLMKKQKEGLKKNILMGMLFSIVYLYVIVLHFTIFLLLFSLLILTGIFICFSIFQLSINQNPILAWQSCNSEDLNGCQKVLHSNIATVWKGITLGDIGLIYFGNQLFFLFLSSIAGSIFHSFLLLSMCTVFSVLFSFFSIFYQLFMIKKWCRLCLMVLAVVWLQAFTLGAYFMQSGIALRITALFINFNSAIFFIISFCVVATLWFSAKSISAKVRDAEKKEIELLKWKRDPNVFYSLLHQQRFVEATPWQEDIVLGNKNADIQLLIVSNPFCSPCAVNHKEIDELLNNYPDLVGVTYRFTVNVDIVEDEGNIAVTHILNACMFHDYEIEGVKHPLDFWFETMDINEFENRYIWDKERNIQELLLRYAKWCKENNILRTPSIFLNGYELPKQYKAHDLKLLIPTLTEIISRTIFQST